MNIGMMNIGMMNTKNKINTFRNSVRGWIFDFAQMPRNLILEQITIRLYFWLVELICDIGTDIENIIGNNFIQIFLIKKIDILWAFKMQ